MSPINDTDLDRLADYAAGLLDPQEERRVDELVRTDPAWRQAHQEIADAQPRIDAALAGLGPVAMPQDVADRLDAAFARETGPADPGTAKVIDISRRRHWTRLAAGTTAAAAAVAAIFAGVVALSGGGLQNNAAPSSGQGVAAPRPNLPSQNALALGPATVLHTGTDYTRRSIGGTADGDKTATSVPGCAPNALTNPDLSAPEDLGRLNDPVALRGCLAAIVAVHGGTPSVVDYARFEGRPALVVILVGTGARRVVVVGPQCGVAGPAEIYTATQ